MKKQRAELWKQFLIASALLMAAQAMLAREADAQPTAAAKPITDTTTPAKPKSTSKSTKPTPKPVERSTALPVASFLDQVAKGNDAYKAAEATRRAADGYSYEAALTLAPTFFAGVKYDSEGKPSPFPIPGLSYSSVDTKTYNAGISKQFANGLKTSFAYVVSDTEYVGLAPKYSEARSQIEASIPLWRNFWGRETMGGVDAARLNALAKAASQNALARSTLAEAEATYWRLALAREALKVSKDSVDRAQAMFDWTSRRVRLALSDRSEHLQSTAQLKARELDLKMAEDAERSARLSFNSARGINSDKVPETLEVLNAALIAKWETPSRTQTRPDIEAARLQAEAAEANAKASAERSKPNFELYGLYAYNSPHRPAQSEAISDSWKRDRPSSQIGVRLNMPLDFSSMRKAQEGWNAEANASRMLVTRKVFEQERDWNDVVAKFQLARDKTRLYEELENAQREKLEHERTRQKSGRSTVRDVILFESDYEQTQFARIGSLAEVLNLNAQMKLYGVAYEAAKEPAASDAAE